MLNRAASPPRRVLSPTRPQFKAPELPPDQQAVTAAPDTTQVRLGGQAAAPGDPAAANHPRLLVVACDGLWDVMDRQQVWHTAHGTCSADALGTAQRGLRAFVACGSWCACLSPRSEGRRRRPSRNSTLTSTCLLHTAPFPYIAGV